MPSSTPVESANAIAGSGSAVDAFLKLPHSQGLLMQTRIDWETSRIVATPPAILGLLTSIGGVEPDRATLTPLGLRFLGRLLLDIDKAVRSSSLTSRYDIGDVIKVGSNSVTFRATNRRVGRAVVLKVLRPRPSGAAHAAIAQLRSFADVPHLVAALDSEDFAAATLTGEAIQLSCVVFPFVSGSTLDSFMRDRPAISPYFFRSFIQQVATALDRLEQQKLAHGDLHAGNILVSNDEAGLSFTIIDPSPGLEPSSPFFYGRSDFYWFKQHLGTALLALQRRLSSISLQKHLGPDLFATISTILRVDELPFATVLRLLSGNPRVAQWHKERASFLEDRFKPPAPLALLRWEEISDPEQAVALFEPFPELFRRLCEFGTSLLIGARGSGKSTYLAAMAYFPNSATNLVECDRIFGILFSCRQGEFKRLSSDHLEFDPATRLAVKHVLVLKVIRRVLTLLRDAHESLRKTPHGDLTALYSFCSSHLHEHVSVPQLSLPDVALANLADGVVRWEEVEIKDLFSGSVRKDRLNAQLNESALLTFFTLVRAVFPTLSTTRFYILFDDAGEPNMPKDAQRVLNDLVTSSNPIYCLKISAERFSYDYQDQAGRRLEEAHDFSSFDIASAYSSESGIDDSRTVVKEYLAKILRRRLAFWKFPSKDIASYLGDQSVTPGKPIAVDELVERLADGRKNAYYAGWDVVWQLADRTPRNLIELVSEIFASAGVRPPDQRQHQLSEVRPISARRQDKAVRTVADRRLRGLEFVAGEVLIAGHTVPLGKHLYLCASTFGKVSHDYIRTYHAVDGVRRVDERLAIERNDTRLLNDEAQRILRLLVQYGVFDDSSLNVAFDDGQKKPVYVLNRVFCPSFQISFRRDAHLRLSTSKLEMYLTEPATFAKVGTALLRNQVPNRQRGLWE